MIVAQPHLSLNMYPYGNYVKWHFSKYRQNQNKFKYPFNHHRTWHTDIHVGPNRWSKSFYLKQHFVVPQSNATSKSIYWYIIYLKKESANYKKKWSEKKNQTTGCSYTKWVRNLLHIKVNYKQGTIWAQIMPIVLQLDLRNWPDSQHWHDTNPSHSIWPAYMHWNILWNI